MSKKITNKDKKDWEDFIKKNQKLYDKDEKKNSSKLFSKSISIDLHGYSLEEANDIIYNFIKEAHSKSVKKISIITGKGSRSKNKEDPYKSKNLSILKYSIPEYINNNVELMEKIKDINYEEVNDISKGSFEIILKN